MEAQLYYFETLYDTYSDSIFRHMYFRLGDRERAKELTQEVFMKTWQHIAAGKSIQYEKAFLYRIAHNQYVNEIRTDKKTHSLDMLIEDGGYDPPDDSADSSDSAYHQELLTYLAQLKESYRTVIVMRYIDDLPITDIAIALSEKETTVSMRLSRAVEKLRTLYEDPKQKNYE